MSATPRLNARDRLVLSINGAEFFNFGADSR